MQLPDQDRLAKIGEVAVQILEELMSEKTGEQLAEIFEQGKEAFNKAKAAGVLFAKLVQRVGLLTESDPESRAMTPPTDETDLDKLVTRGYVRIFQES